MRDLAKGKCFWPGMLKHLTKKYNGCLACILDSKTVIKAHIVVPENLEFLAPGKQISADFAHYNNHNIVVIKD